MSTKEMLAAIAALLESSPSESWLQTSLQELEISLDLDRSAEGSDDDFPGPALCWNVGDFQIVLARGVSGTWTECSSGQTDPWALAALLVTTSLVDGCSQV